MQHQHRIILPLHNIRQFTQYKKLRCYRHFEILFIYLDAWFPPLEPSIFSSIAQADLVHLKFAERMFCEKSAPRILHTYSIPIIHPFHKNTTFARWCPDMNFWASSCHVRRVSSAFRFGGPRMLKILKFLARQKCHANSDFLTCRPTIVSVA